MRDYYFCAWRTPPDAAFLSAVAKAANVDAHNARLLDSWDHVDKADPFGPEVEPPKAQVYVEWTPAGDSLVTCQIHVFGPAIREDESEPSFARRLARLSGWPLLFSDCHVYPNTWMMAREDGAIVHVVVRDDDDMTLLPEDPREPDHWARDVLFAPDDPLPQPTAAELDARGDPPDRCKAFGGACPKRKFLCPNL